MNQDRSKAAAQNQSGRARTGQNLANSYQILPGGGVPALETLVSDESSGFGNRAFVRAMADGQHVSADREMQTGKRYVSGRTDGALFSAASSEMRRRPSDILPVGMRPTEAAAYIGDARQSDASDPMSNENLVWDQAAAVMEMYQQIEMIGEGVARGWEPPSVPLEMMPASREGGASGLQPAGERRTP